MFVFLLWLYALIWFGRFRHDSVVYKTVLLLFPLSSVPSYSTEGKLILLLTYLVTDLPIAIIVLIKSIGKSN